MMWCNDCKKVVEIVTVYESQCEEPNGREAFDICKECGGGDLNLITQCKNPNCENDMPDNGEDYCDSCHEETGFEIRKMVILSKSPMDLLKDEMQKYLEG